MILWCDGAHDAAENMRRDARLLERLARRRVGAHEPVLRLFRFAPPGHHARTQPATRSASSTSSAARRDGVSWAVRPTGGRAIFHDRGVDVLARRAPRRSRLGRLARSGATRASRADRRRRSRGSACRRSHATGEARVRSARATLERGLLRLDRAPRDRGRGPQAGRQRAAAHRGARCSSRAACCSGPDTCRLARYLRARRCRSEVLRARSRRRRATPGAWLGFDPPIERWADEPRRSLRHQRPSPRRRAGRVPVDPRKRDSYTSAALELTSTTIDSGEWS